MAIGSVMNERNENSSALLLVAVAVEIADTVIPAIDSKVVTAMVEQIAGAV
jgi:hypothetical protein